MTDQLELQPSRSGDSAAARTPSGADRDLTIPASKAVASQFALAWARRGFAVDVVPRGRLWVVRG